MSKTLASSSRFVGFALAMAAVAVVTAILVSREGPDAGRLEEARLPDEASNARLAPSAVRQDEPRDVPVGAAPSRHDLGSVALDDAAVGEASDEPTPAAETSIPPAMSRCLRSFLSSEPDILGWNGYLNELAASAELDASSLREEKGKLKGTFVVPEAGMTIQFTISDEGYTLESNSTFEDLGPEHGAMSFHAALAFQATDGSIEMGHGVVQFMPQDGQTFYEEGPIGYLYDLDDEKTAFRAMHGEVREDGDYWVDVPSPDANQVKVAGDLGAAYHWMSRLQEVERGRSSRR